ncbi:hypothetical protein EZV62_019438 [Acer yangbiense]|uniref:Endonuclease/exonuclease/phosphatase domain-containing protein n=1 Tax=Acer yangbiense TaxID=1000413 RepID=A0A5C7HCG4_9ROSI|nr:hypothetical protein EZV62_019438 [Acer yangbiense]
MHRLAGSNDRSYLERTRVGEPTCIRGLIKAAQKAFFRHRHIDARVCSEDGFCWRFSGIYGDPNSSRRKFSWALLWSIKSFSDMYNFRQVVDDYNLTDLGFTGPKYTWNNKRDGNSNIQERLDRFLANDLWRDKFSNVNVTHLGFNSFDHRLILFNSSNPSEYDTLRASKAIKARLTGNMYEELSLPYTADKDVFHSLASRFNSDDLSLVCMLA